MAWERFLFFRRMRPWPLVVLTLCLVLQAATFDDLDTQCLGRISRFLDGKSYANFRVNRHTAHVCPCLDLPELQQWLPTVRQFPAGRSQQRTDGRDRDPFETLRCLVAAVAGIEEEVLSQLEAQIHSRARRHPQSTQRFPIHSDAHYSSKMTAAIAADLVNHADAVIRNAKYEFLKHPTGVLALNQERRKKFVQDLMSAIFGTISLRDRAKRLAMMRAFFRTQIDEQPLAVREAILIIIQPYAVGAYLQSDGDPPFAYPDLLTSELLPLRLASLQHVLDAFSYVVKMIQSDRFLQQRFADCNPIRAFVKQSLSSAASLKLLDLCLDQLTPRCIDRRKLCLKIPWALLAVLRGYAEYRTQQSTRSDWRHQVRARYQPILLRKLMQLNSAPSFHTNQ